MAKNLAFAIIIPCGGGQNYGENTKKMSYFRANMGYSGPNLGYTSCALHARSNMKITLASEWHAPVMKHRPLV